MLVVARIAVLIGLLCSTLAAAAPVEEERSIDAVFAEHVKAVQSRDLPSLERTITLGEQLTLILPNGVQTSTRQAYVDFHKEFFADEDLDDPVRAGQSDPRLGFRGADDEEPLPGRRRRQTVSQPQLGDVHVPEGIGTVAAGPRPEHAVAARATVVATQQSFQSSAPDPRPTARISSTVSSPMHGIAPRARTSPRSNFRASAIAGKHGTCGP